jgi:ADP-heptose:LPS heptosyltransferase
MSGAGAPGPAAGRAGAPARAGGPAPGGARRVPAAPARPLADPGTRRVLLVRLRVGLGDLLASVPALRALRAARPDAEVTLLTWAEMAPVVTRMGAYVDELLDFPGWPGIPERPPRVEALPRFLAETRRRRFDLAVQMYGGQPAANQVTERLGAGRTAGFFTPGQWDADLATHLPYPFREREVRRHLELVEFLGVPPGGEDLEFPLWPEDLEEAEALRRRHRLAPGGFACLHPGATAASRRWPPERFAAVADALAARGLPVALVGTPGEAPVAAAVAAAMRAPAVDLTGQTSLGGFAALLASAALLVGNDSGPAQLAAAVGCPAVTVFLAGDPTRWSPPDPRYRALQAGVPCQPCGHQACPIDFRCAFHLDPGRVAAEAARLMDDLGRLPHLAGLGRG